MLISQPDPNACSDEQHSAEVQDRIDTEQDDETQNVGVNQRFTPAPTPRAEREPDDQTNNDEALVLENRSASVPTTGTEETPIANHEVTTPSVKPNCVQTNLSVYFHSALPVRIDHPSIRTSDTALPLDELVKPPPASKNEPTTHAIQVGDGDKENGFVTATSATKEPALAVDNNCLETREDGDLNVVLADKGKGVNPEEYGGGLYDPNSRTFLSGTTSTGGSESIELVGVHRDKGKNVDPEERRNGMGKFNPGPSRIDFKLHDHVAVSSQTQGIPLESFKPTNLNHGLPHDPTLPQPSWHPKISPYRFMVFSIPLVIGIAKAVLSPAHKEGSVTTLEWISSLVIFIILFLLGSYETRKDIPKYLSWLFKLDCLDFVWYLAAKLSIQRPEYLSNECDRLEFDLGAVVTSYRILVSAAVVLLGSIKITFAHLNSFIGAIWVEWLLAAFVFSSLYLVGLYEKNSLGLWSSFFRDNRYHLLFDLRTPIPIILGLAYFFVVYSTKVLPGVNQFISDDMAGNYSDLQLYKGPTPFHGTLEGVYVVVTYYIPFVVFFFWFLGPLIFYLRVPILALASMLPSVVRYHTGRFIGAVERLSHRRPIDRIIYHFVAFGQLLLFMSWNVWVFLLVYFGTFFPTVEIKYLIYSALLTVLILVWIIAATGKFGEIRWWPSKDRFSRLVPPSIKPITKFIQLKVKPLFDFDVYQILFVLSVIALGIGTMTLFVFSLFPLHSRPQDEMLVAFWLRFAMVLLIAASPVIDLGLVMLLTYLFVALLHHGLQQDFPESLRQFVGPRVANRRFAGEAGNETTNLNHGLPYDLTLPQPSWHPKISPYRFMVFSIPLVVGTVKAVLSQKGSVTTPITLEWISGIAIFLVFFLLEPYDSEPCRNIPRYLVWLFKPDCVDLVWYLAAKLSIQRPEYLSNERDLEFDPGPFFTLYRILVSATVVFLGCVKSTFAFSNSFVAAIWVEWLLGAFGLSFLYLGGLYETNSLGLWSWLFREDRSDLLWFPRLWSWLFREDRSDLLWDPMDFNPIPIPIIVVLAYLFVVFSTKVLPNVMHHTHHYEDYTSSDFQLPMGPSLSQDTLERVSLVFTYYMPFVIGFFWLLGFLIFCLWIPILTLTSMLPSVIRHHSARFIGAVERFFQRHPIDRVIYHSVAFGQLLLFVGWNIWIFLIARIALSPNALFFIKFLFYLGAVIVSIVVWTMTATGRFGKVRWWPSKDCLSRFVPPKIKNAAITKFIQRHVEAAVCHLDGVSLCSLAIFLFVINAVVAYFIDETTMGLWYLRILLTSFLTVPIFAMGLVIWLCLGCPSPAPTGACGQYEEEVSEEEGEGKILDLTRMSEALRVSTMNAVALNDASTSAASSSSSNPFP